MMQTVLLAGATGMFGSRVARHLVNRRDVRLRLLVRPAEGAAKKDALSPFVDVGVEIIRGNLADRLALDKATQGVDVIVSAVQGGPEVITEGQVALAEAAKRNGVRRILPSDYALDLFKATPGEHAMFDMRAKADGRIRELGLEQINVLQGAFMDMFLPGGGAVDLGAGTISFFGDGNQPIEVTSVEDTARMVARVAVDRDAPQGKFAFAGDRVTMREAGDIIAARTGRPLRAVSLGSEADLRAAMASADPQKKVMLAYQLYMTNGQTALSDLQNARYDIRFERLADFIERSVPRPT
jgi:uncharacterized protein YbjT (DUF2867 family)